MINILIRELRYIGYYYAVQFERFFWYWVAGLVIGALISAFAKDRIFRLFGRMNGTRMGAFGIIPACLLRFANPLWLSGTLPIAASLERQGMRHDWLAAFMTASILLNPQMIVFSAALGSATLIVRIVTCLLCSCAAGLVIRFLYGNQPFFDFTDFALSESREPDGNGLLRFLKELGRNFKATVLCFLGGVLLAVLFQQYIPEGYVAMLFGANRVRGVLLAAAVGLLFVANGSGSVPPLREWMVQGMSMGSAAAFMIVGPATRLTDLGALRKLLGTKRFLAYLLFVTAFAVAAGIVVNLISV